MPRFELMSAEDAKNKLPDDYDQGDFTFAPYRPLYDLPDVVVDHEKKAIVASDAYYDAPEDNFLNRSFSWVIPLLNEVNEERSA